MASAIANLRTSVTSCFYPNTPEDSEVRCSKCGSPRRQFQRRSNSPSRQLETNSGVRRNNNYRGREDSRTPRASEYGYGAPPKHWLRNRADGGSDRRRRGTSQASSARTGSTGPMVTIPPQVISLPNHESGPRRAPFTCLASSFGSSEVASIGLLNQFPKHYDSGFLDRAFENASHIIDDYTVDCFQDDEEMNMQREDVAITYV